MDLMPTCLEAGGTAHPREFNGQPITLLASQSLLPALRGTPLNRPDPLFWEHEDNRAVRQGQWKLVSEHLGP